MSHELAAVVIQNSVAISNEHFMTRVGSDKKLKCGTPLYAWRFEPVREIYEQAERDYHRHNPTLDGQS